MAELGSEQWTAVEAEIFAGRKIQAIKLYRAATNCDLKTAKDAVEERERQLRGTSPERFAAPQRSGCMGVLVLVACAVTLLTSFLFS
jgi:hypothetical protein